MWLPGISAVVPFLIASVTYEQSLGTLHLGMNLTVMVLLVGWGSFLHEESVREKWCARQELDETSALADAMQGVARTLCDVVMQFSEDLRVLDADQEHVHKEYFGMALRNKSFKKVLSDSDCARFDQVMKQAKASLIPQCLSATVKTNKNEYEARFFVVAMGTSNSSFCIGMCVERGAYTLPPAVDGSTIADECSFISQPLPSIPESDEDSEDTERSSNGTGHRHSSVHTSDKSRGSPRRRRSRTQSTSEAYDVTPMWSIQASLYLVMQRWQVPRSPDACCPFHDSAHHANSALTRLLRLGCKPLWSGFDGWQCPECLCLNLDGVATCQVCNTDDAVANVVSL